VVPEPITKFHAIRHPPCGGPFVRRARSDDSATAELAAAEHQAAPALSAIV
jgi:hypothetical protein